MKQIILPVLAFSIVRAIFWFGGVDLMERNLDNGMVMFISAGTAFMAFCAAKGGLLE